MRVVVVGSVTLDEQHIRSSPVRFQLGGVVTYAGAAFATVGVRPLAVCSLGGPMGERARAILHSLGMDVCASRSNRMTGFVNTVDADGERQQELSSAAPPISRRLAVQAMQGVEGPHVHLGPVHGADISDSALIFLGARARTVSLDIQGLLRPSAPGPMKLQRAASLETALTMSSIVKATEEELVTLLTVTALTLDELMVTFKLDEIVVTQGSRGGYVADRSGKQQTFDAAPIDGVVDTTGAGDVFFAAYVLARIHELADVGDACRRAAVQAARHVSGNLIDPDLLSLPLGDRTPVGEAAPRRGPDG